MKISVGLVIIQNNMILLGHPTNGSWSNSYSFPKGHLKNNESILDAALRETEEEIGLIVDINDIDFNTLECIEYKKNDNVYKKVYYYLVYPKSDIDISKLILQMDEINSADFFNKEDAEELIFWRLKDVLKHLK
jgi:bis(5'-nucleosidyl)-tetraphosphatase